MPRMGPILTAGHLGSKQRGFTRSISLIPSFKAFKLLPQPPGNIVGTVNDPYAHPKTDWYHGTFHWSYERIVSTALVPLGMAPFIVGVDQPMIDSAFAVLLAIHCHIGLVSCIVDYIPKRVFGIWHRLATGLLTIGTCATIYGIYILETTSNGVFSLASELWSS